MANRDAWHEIEDLELCGQALVARAQRHRNTSSPRRERACYLLSVYENLSIERFAASAYDSATGFTFDVNNPIDGETNTYEQTHNIGARIMDAIDAKMFALGKRKTDFVMSDGGWAVRSAGIQASRFIEGQMTEPQGMFPDMWQLWRHAARLAVNCTEAAMVFFWSDPSQGKIVAELDDTLNVWLETTGLPYDGYTSLGRITFWDPMKLALRFPEHAEEIRAAAVDANRVREWRELLSEDDDDDIDALRVPFIQGWRMKIAGGTEEGGLDGVECGAIPGTTLYRKTYDYDYPPCERFCPMPRLAGVWGRTILERAVGAIRRYSEILNSIDKAERVTPKGVLFYDPSVTDEQVLQKVKDVVPIPHTGPMDRVPIYKPVDPVTPIALELLELHKNAAYDLTGMNEAHATMNNIGKSMSGVAIRLVKQEVYEMFSALESELDRCVGPGTARQIMRCARELQKEGGFSAVWKGGQKGGWLQEIPASVFDILEDQTYRTAASPVNGDKNTPADRVATAQELMEVGVITGEAYASILQDYNTYGHAGNELTMVEESFIEKQINAWLHGDIDDAEKHYIAPEIWMDKNLSLTLKVGAAYLQARMDMIEDMADPVITRRLKLFKDFSSKLAANYQKRQMLAQQAQMGAPQQAAPAA